MKHTHTHQRAQEFVLYYLSGLIALTILGVVLRVLFYMYNRPAFVNLSHQQLADSLLNGLTFDIAVAALGMILIIIPFWLISRFGLSQSLYKRCIYLIASIIVLTQTSDTLYFSNAGRHVSYEVKDVFVDANGLLATAFFQHGWFIFISILISILMTIGILKLSMLSFKRLFSQLTAQLPALFRYELIFLCLFFISIILIRGGIFGLPQEPLSAFKSGNTSQGQITLNGAYSISHRLLSAIEKVKKINIPALMPLTENQIKNKIAHNTTETVRGSLQPYNVVMVFLESWQAAQMKSYGGEDDVTPYFDHLRKQSISPDYVYAGGYRTTEGLFSTLCSFQNPLGKTVAQSQLQSFDYLCLPHVLKSKGWDTAFFQGSNKNTSGTGIFAQRLGFTNSYGKSDILNPKYEHNYWGAHDPDLYQFVLDKTQKLKEPFFIGINTTTTHDDTLPSEITPQFGMDNPQQRYKSVLHFSDQSLKQFILQFQTTKRQNKTLFVLIADHTAGVFHNELTRVLIPGIIYSADINLQKKLNRAVHQRDFAPTLLSLLNIESPRSFAGQSMLNAPSNLWDAEFYSPGHLSVVHQNTLVNFNLLNQNQSCFSIIYQKLALNPATCQQSDSLIMHSALGFSRYSQNLLFNGKTMDYGTPLSTAVTQP